MRAIFIRHGESTGNIDQPGPDAALFPLTDRGWRQAREVAAGWTQTPTLIVRSPFLRAQQSALPTCQRFADVPVETWPIQELTFLAPGRWNGSLRQERRPHVVRYWTTADPDYCDGEGAESFSDLLRRCEHTLQRLAALPPSALVLVFSHGQFIETLRSLVIDPDAPPRERMIKHWNQEGPPPVANGEQVHLVCVEGGWRWEGDGSGGRGVGEVLV